MGRGKGRALEVGGGGVAVARAGAVGSGLVV